MGFGLGFGLGFQMQKAAALGGGGEVFFTDFSAYTNDELPSDWSKPFPSDTTVWTVQPDAAYTGGKYLYMDQYDSTTNGLVWDVIGEGAGAQDGIAVVRGRQPGFSADVNIIARAQTIEGTNYSYKIGFDDSNSDLRIWKQTGGIGIVGFASLASLGITNPQTDDFYYIKAQLIGADIKVKMWLEGEEEPEEWQLERTDDSDPILSAGGWGVTSVDSSDSFFDTFQFQPL